MNICIIHCTFIHTAVPFDFQIATYMLWADKIIAFIENKILLVPVVSSFYTTYSCPITDDHKNNRRPFSKTGGDY